MFAANSRLCYHIAEMKLFQTDFRPAMEEKEKSGPTAAASAGWTRKKHPSRKIRSGCPEVSRRMNYFITSPRFLVEVHPALRIGFRAGEQLFGIRRGGLIERLVAVFTADEVLGSWRSPPWSPR